MFSCSPSFLFGKDGDFLSAKNTFPEASGNAPPTFKCFPKLRKTPRRRKSSFRNFGNLRADGKTLSETSENPAPAEKLFPKLRKPPRRRKNAFRNFGKPRGGGKVLSETPGNPAPTEKRFPKLREALPCRGNTKKAATINSCDSFTSFYKINKIIPRTKSGHRQPQPNR